MTMTKKLITIASIIFAVALGACDNPKLSVKDSSETHLSVCDTNEVEDLVVHVTFGGAKVRITSVAYTNAQAFNTNIEFNLGTGDVVTIPYCRGMGDVHFRVEVAPTGDGLVYGYDYSVEIFYEVYGEHLDVRIWDNAGFENFGTGIAGIGTHTNGESNTYFVAVEPHMW